MAIWNRRQNAAQAVEARLDALKSDFLALQDDVKGLARGVSAAASDMIQSTSRGAEDALESVGDWTTDNVGSVRDQVRKQPLAASALSVGAGAVIGAILSRR